MKRLLFILIFFFGHSLYSEQVVILGSGPAGLTAAIYAARSGLSTLVIAGDLPGGQISKSYHVENFPGFKEGINGYELFQNMQDQAIRFGATYKTAQVIDVDLRARPFTITLDDQTVVYADTLIIATGASSRKLGLESEKHFFGMGLSTCAVCDGSLFKEKKVVVVGGGDSALEEALFLSNFAKEVTVIHRKAILKASPYLQELAFKNPKIQYVFNSAVVEILDTKQNRVTAVKIKNTLTDELRDISCDGVFLAIGYIPNSDLFKGKLSMDENGYIIVEPFSTKTSINGVFAAGDIADPHYRQAITAAASGSMAAIDAYQYIQSKQTN